MATYRLFLSGTHKGPVSVTDEMACQHNTTAYEHDQIIIDVAEDFCIDRGPASVEALQRMQWAANKARGSIKK